MQSRQRFVVLFSLVVVGSSMLGCNLLADRQTGPYPISPQPSEAPTSSDVARASFEQPDADAEQPDADAEQPETPEKPSLSVTDFYPSNLGKTFKKMTGRGPSQQAARQLYDQGEARYREALEARADDDAGEPRRLFLKASDQFISAAERWPDSALEEDAMFRAAESQFFADRYPKANEYLEQLLKKYPNTRYLDVVGARRFLIAKYWLELDHVKHQNSVTVNLTDPTRPRTDTFGNAVRILDRMRIDDPTGKLADDATLAAANAYFAHGDFLKADQYYSDLRMTFPSSEHQFMAHFLGLKAKLESYKGPDYAGGALDEAEKLIKQMRRQFPRQARKHEKELELAFREVRYRMAEREWYMGQYYTRRKEYGAARFYYGLILKDYARTPFAEQAREQLGLIVEKPAKPAQKLTWLVKLFPDTRDEKPLIATSPQQTKRR